MSMAMVAPCAARVEGKRALAEPVRFVLLCFGLSWAALIRGWLLAGRPGDLRAPGKAPAVYLSSFGLGLAAAPLSAREGRFRAWASGWSAEVSCAHAMLAFRIAAGMVWFCTRGRR